MTQRDYWITFVGGPAFEETPVGKHSDPDKPQDQRGDPKDNDSQHPSPHGGGGEKQGK
jgi:hypothetical protein